MFIAEFLPRSLHFVAYSPLPNPAFAPTFEGKKIQMVETTQNTLIITLPTDEPARKLADLRGSLLFVLNDFFSHLDNTVDVDSGAAYNDLILLLRAMLPAGEAMEGMKKTVAHRNQHSPNCVIFT
jgi:hypothetical protein